jgi:predicted transcriptional regulator of viral defense system
MVKSNYLSREEQRIWEYIKNKDIIDTELITYIFPDFSANKRSKSLHRLCKKGYLKRIIKGIYYNPENLEDYYQLALKIHDGYIGLTSALKYYGLTDYEDFTIFVMTEKIYRKVDIENYSIRLIPLGDMYDGYIKKDGIKISSIEKTFFDCFLRIKYLNYSILTKAIYDAKNVNWDKFLKYFDDAPTSLRQKAGYILELLSKETDFKIDDKALNMLKKGIKHPIKLESNARKSKFDSRWKIEDNIGKEKILSWWY